MTARKTIGFLIAVLGILLGIGLSIPGIILAAGYWNAAETGGNAGRAILVLMIVFGFLIGYGIYRLGRKIAG